MLLGIYTRISKDRENQISTEVQKEQGIKLSKELKIPYKLYEEAKGTSGGKKIKDRPKLQELIDDIDDRIITHIYVYNQDRAERDEITWFTLVETIIGLDIKLYENGLYVDFDNEDVRMLAGFKTVLNASFRRKTGKKIKDALYKKAKDGIATNPVLSYGYKKNKNKYIVIDKKEARIVKRIFKESLEGIGTQKISYGLNDDKVPTRYAKTSKGTITTKNKLAGTITTKLKADVIWSQNTVLQIIKNTWHYGDRPYKGEVFEVPAIFSREYWQKVNDNLQNNRLRTGAKTHKYLLKGTLRCSCGKMMYGKNNNLKSENFYHCSSHRTRNENCGSPSINRPRLDALIWGEFFNNDILKEKVIEHFEKTDEKDMLINLNEELVTHIKQLQTNEKEKTNVISFARQSIITPEELELQLKVIRTKLNQIETKILNTENQIETYKNILKSADDITKELNKFKNTKSFNDKKTIIQKYIESIVVSYKEKHYVVEVFFTIPNMHQYHIIVQKRFYYAFEPFRNDYKVINNFPKKLKGKVIYRTDDEFFKEIYTDERFTQVFTIRHQIISEYMNNSNDTFRSKADKAKDKKNQKQILKEFRELEKGYLKDQNVKVQKLVEHYKKLYS